MGLFNIPRHSDCVSNANFKANWRNHLHTILAESEEIGIEKNAPWEIGRKVYFCMIVFSISRPSDCVSNVIFIVESRHRLHTVPAKSAPTGEAGR